MSTATYIGDNNIEEVPGAKLSVRRGQASTLVRPYEGNVAFVQSFLSSNPLYTTHDYEYSYMVLDKQDVEYDGPLAKITLTFFGYPLTFNSVPNLQTSGSWEPRSAFLETDVAADGEWLVNYYSSTITYKYTTTGIIDTPQFQGYSQNPSYVTILDCSQRFPAGAVGPPAPYTRVGEWQYKIFAVCTSFRFDQKGVTYNYQETWTVILQKPNSTNQQPYALSVSSASQPSSQ